MFKALSAGAYASHSGVFFVVEGMDGCGKSTLCNGLSKWLNNSVRKQDRVVPTISTREPAGTPLGQHLKDYVQADRSIAPLARLGLIFASQADHVERVIWPVVSRGGIVICDRFKESTEAYQYGVVDPQTMSMLHHTAAKGLTADMVLYLKAPADVCLERSLERGGDLSMYERKRDWAREIVARYDRLAKENPKTIMTLDAATQTPEMILETAKSHVLRVLRNKGYEVLHDTKEVETTKHRELSRV